MKNTSKKAQKAQPIQYFARCEGISCMGPFDTEFQAWQAVMATNGLPVPGAIVWPSMNTKI